MSTYDHMHIKGLGRASVEFRSRGRGSSPPDPTPIPNRQRHARKLKRDIERVATAIEDARVEQRRNGVAKKDSGLPVAVDGVSGEVLRQGSARLDSTTLPLLSLRRGSEGQPDLATFFANSTSLASLSKALDRYSEYREGRKPQRFNLFESAQAIRLATVEDLWNDIAERLPVSDEVEEWEVWVLKARLGPFNRAIERLALETPGEVFEFEDSVVLSVLGDRDAIEDLVRLSAAVAELRSASSFVAEYHEQDPAERVTSMREVRRLITEPSVDAPRTTLLDTGVSLANPLINVATDVSDCHSIEEDWDFTDHCGHGSNMAGIALYGDFDQFVGDGQQIQLTTRLESVVISAPDGARPVAARDAIPRGVDEVENAIDAGRVFCIAGTIPDDPDDGRTTSAASAIDSLAWGNGNDTRLFCVAAGNVEAPLGGQYQAGAYDQRNAASRVQSPGQAVNALTIGALTERCEGFTPLAPIGDLCPTSRTSQTWRIRGANKPDIVLEGGNHVLEEGGVYSSRNPTTMLLTTGRTAANPFDSTGETSAATARAAGLATRLKAQYPQFRAETLRALMTNSARWTDAMKARFAALRQLRMSEIDAWGNILDCYGWGMPDEQRLFASAADALTLVVEDRLEPYQESNGRVGLKQMKYFKLPWPDAELRQLGQTQVQLRCTLSYFAQPDPGASSRGRPDRYLSHRLRFALKSADMTDLQAQQQVNIFASAEDVEDDEDDVAAEFIGSTGADRGWAVGDARRRKGSLHQDVWTGPAFQLADRGGVSVYPVHGWWSERRSSRIWDQAVPFSLVVSIMTPESEVDLMAASIALARSRNLVTNLTPALLPVRPRRR